MSPLSVGSLTGPQKAAIVVSQMPSETADGVLSGLSEVEVSRLSRYVATLPEVDEPTVKAVMGEFISTFAPVWL